MRKVRVMKNVLKILTVGSLKDLYRFKSFFLLIFLLIVFDRIIHLRGGAGEFAFRPSDIGSLFQHLDVYLFKTLPTLFFDGLTSYRFASFAILLFVFKQVLSLWPSSDMRRMHRFDRSGFGIFTSLSILRFQQIAWDALAVGVVCGVVSIWTLFSFLISYSLWTFFTSFFWVFVLVAMVSASIPILFAGLSYSSKLAVLSQGGYLEKLDLFFKLFTDRRVLFYSWVFFSVRLFVESVFVVAIPAFILVEINTFWARIILAGLCVTPVYSYLKMASFKFFLEIYRDSPLVYHEYQTYYLLN